MLDILLFCFCCSVYDLGKMSVPFENVTAIVMMTCKEVIPHGLKGGGTYGGGRAELYFKVLY